MTDEELKTAMLELFSEQKEERLRLAEGRVKQLEARIEELEAKIKELKP